MLLIRALKDLGARKAGGFSGSSGSVHLMGSLLLILALIGVGYLYSSYKENKLSGDLPRIMAAYERMLDDSIKDPEDRAKLKQAFGILAELIYKYNPAGLNLKAVEAIERQKMLLESRPAEGKND